MGLLVAQILPIPILATRIKTGARTSTIKNATTMTSILAAKIALDASEPNDQFFSLDPRIVERAGGPLSALYLVAKREPEQRWADYWRSVGFMFSQYLRPGDPQQELRLWGLVSREVGGQSTGISNYKRLWRSSDEAIRLCEMTTQASPEILVSDVLGEYWCALAEFPMEYLGACAEWAALGSKSFIAVSVDPPKMTKDSVVEFWELLHSRSRHLDFNSLIANLTNLAVTVSSFSSGLFCFRGGSDWEDGAMTVYYNDQVLPLSLQVPNTAP